MTAGVMKITVMHINIQNIMCVQINCTAIRKVNYKSIFIYKGTCLSCLLTLTYKSVVEVKKILRTDVLRYTPCVNEASW